VPRSSILILAIAMLACGSCAPPATAAPTPIAGAPEVVVVATEMRFTPGQIKVPAAAVNVTLKNEGSLPHDLTVPTLGVYIVAQPGQSVTVGLRDLPKATQAGWCGIQGHRAAGMQMDVFVGE